MSLFLGKHNNKPLLHSTRNEQSKEELTAGPNKDTIFHSDLPYILVHDRIDVPMSNSTKTYKTYDLRGEKTIGHNIVVPEGVIPQKVRDHLAEGLAYTIVVHRDNRQYTVQPQISVEPGGLSTLGIYGLSSDGQPTTVWGTGSDRLTFTEGTDYPNYPYFILTSFGASMDTNTDRRKTKLLHDHSPSRYSKRVQWWGSTKVQNRGMFSGDKDKYLSVNITDPTPPDKLEFIFFKVKKTPTGLVNITNSVGDIKVDNKTLRVGDTNLLDQEYLVVGSEVTPEQEFVQPLYGMPKGKLRLGYVNNEHFWYGTSKFRAPIQTCSYFFKIISGYGPGSPIGYYQKGHRIEEDILYDPNSASRYYGPQNKLMDSVEIPKFSIINSKGNTGIRLENENIIIKTGSGDIDLFTTSFKPRYVIKGYDKVSTASVDYRNLGLGSSRGLRTRVTRNKVGEVEANLGEGKAACIAFVRLLGTKMLDLQVDGKYANYTSNDVYTLKETEGMCGLIEFEDNKEIVVCSYTARGAASGGFSGEDGQFHFGLRGLISLEKKGSKIEVYNTMYTAIKNWGIWSASFTARRVQVPGIEVILSELY